MRILLIDVNYKFSSTGKIVFDLRNQINESGNEAYVAFGRGPKSSDKNVLKFGIYFETLIDAFLTRITGLVGYFSLFSTLKLISYIKAIKPNVIHLHEIHSYFLNLPLFYSYLSKSRIKIIHTLHNEFVYTGKCWDTSGCNKFSTNCGNCPKLNQYPKTLIFDFTKFMHLHKNRLIQNLENVIFVSPSYWLKRNFDSSILKNKKCIVIRNGIDINNGFSTSRNNHFLKYRIPLNFKKYVLFVSSDPFSENKGGKYLFELAKINTDIFYAVIGDSNSTISNLSNLHIFPKINDRKILFNFYYNFDASLILSRHENLPTVVIESLSAGTPVFGFHSKGSNELISQNFGRLVYYGDIGGLLESLNSYFNGIKTEIWSKEKIIEYFNSNFSKEKMFEKYLELYNI